MRKKSGNLKNIFLYNNESREKIKTGEKIKMA